MNTLTNHERRRAIMDAANAANPTLNGKPATVHGVKSPFASVTALASGESYHWTWQAIERITQNRNAAFKS